jgi:hypothetical protein
VTDLRHAWEVLEMAHPEWFFDDELSRLRWEWAASMREPEFAADRGRGRRLGLKGTPNPAWRGGDGGKRAAWTSLRRDQHADEV